MASHRSFSRHLSFGVSTAALVCAFNVHLAKAANDAHEIYSDDTGTILIDDTDTWDIDATRTSDSAFASGNTNVTLEFNDANSNTSLTITSAAGANDQAFVGNITVKNDGTGSNTNTLTVGDGEESITLNVIGSIEGDFDPEEDGADPSDLNIIVDAQGGGEADTVLRVERDIDLGAGGIVLNSDDNGTAVLEIIEAAVSQTIIGKINGAVQGEGVLFVRDLESDEMAFLDTFETAIGAEQGLEEIIVGSGTSSGYARFKSSVVSENIRVIAGNHADEDSIIEFEGNVEATEISLNDHDTADFGDASIAITGAGVQAILGLIVGDAAGEGTLIITDPTADTVADEDVVGNAVGGTKLGAIVVGSSTLSGVVDFQAAVSANTITVTGGDHANEDSTVQFSGAANVTTTTITLDDTALGGTATMKVTNTSAQTIAGTIDGQADGEGNLVVTDPSTGEDGTVDIFSNNVGATHALSSIQIGATTASGAARFMGSVSATNIIVDGGDTNEDSTIEFRGNVTATSISLDTNTGTAEMTVTGAAAQTIAGTIDGAAAGEGALVITDLDAGEAPTADTFSGVIGGTSSLLSINVGSSTLGGSAIFSEAVSAATITVTGGDHEAEDNSISFAGDVTATTITLDDETGVTSIVFNGSSEQTVVGNITAATAGNGTLTISNDTIFTGNIGATRLGTLTLAANKTMTMGVAGSSKSLGATTATINGTLKLNDSIAIATGTTLTLANGSTLEIIDPTAIATGEAVIDATSASTVVLAAGEMNLVLPTSFRQGSIILVDASGDGTLTETGAFSIEDTALIDYTLSTVDDQIILTAAIQSVEELTENVGVNENSAKALANALLIDDDTISEAFEVAIEAGGAQLQKAAEQSSNATSALTGAAAATAQVGFTATNTSFVHLAEVRNGNTGMAAGNHGSDGAIWAKSFYNSIDQGTKDDIAGYEADTLGGMVGADVYSDESTTLGVAFSYAASDIWGDGLGRDETNIESYQGLIYGDYRVRSWYVEGSAGYAHNEVETSRHIDFGGLDLTARGDYEGNQYMANVATGVSVDVAENVQVIPNIGLRYTFIDYDSYTETGAGAMNLTVAPDELSILEGTLGAKLRSTLTMEEGKLIPEVRAGVVHDFIGDEAASSSAFAGAGSAFNATGVEAEEFGAVVGASIAYDMGSVVVSMGYDGDFRDEYMSQTALGEVRVRF